MAKNVLQSTILSGAGAVAIAPGAQIEVRNPDGLLAPLWLDRDGTQPTTNPTTADSDGFFRVYLNSGRYHITARSGDESREWRDVLLGSAAGYDVDDMLAALAAGVYTGVAEGLANTAEGDFFWVALEAGEDVLTLYRVVDDDAELWAALPRGEVVRELVDRAEMAAESAGEDAQAAQDALDAILALGDLPSAVAAAEQAATTAIEQAGIATAKASEAATSAQTAADKAAEASAEADRAEAAADDLEMAKVPMFFVAWCPDRNHIWPGYVAADGQQLSSASYPDAAAGIAAGTVPTTDGATWLADPSQRGKYVADDGSGFFRVPDYNGKQAGSLGAVFLRGDGERSAGVSGEIQEDAFQNITGAFRVGAAAFERGGAFTVSPEGDRASGAGTPSGARVDFDASLVARTADETRPLNVTGCWVIKLYGEVVNVGSADAEQLASDFANLNGAFQALDSQIDFAIVYPGGGDASSPGEVGRNSIYEVASPFPGHYLILHPELFYNGKWVTISPGLAATGARQSAGVLAGQDGDSILVRTGTTWLITDNGSNLSTAEAPVGTVGPLPCRVKVWKSKGVF